MVMPVIDSHAHLSKIYRGMEADNKDTFLEDKFVPKNTAGLKKISKFPMGMAHIITIEDNPLRWHERRHENDKLVSVVIGCHPNSVQHWDEMHTDQIGDIIKIRRNIRGIGETGLDSTRGVSLSLQENIFRLHMTLSLDFSLPIVLHLRGDGMNKRGFDLLYKVLGARSSSNL